MSTAYSSAKQKYIGNGVTTEWGFDFPIQKHSELKVYLKRSGLPQVLLEEGVDYSFVTENTIAFPIKTGEAKLQAADVLALQRESVFESEYNFSNQQRLEPEEVMHADDNLERQIQELKRDSESSIKVFPTSSVDPTTLVEHVERVYGSVDNIDTVANDKANLDKVAGSISNVNTVAGIASSVTTVANNNANITKVGTNISSVNTAATNIAAIKNAPTAASNASQSATNAANSAKASANSATASANSANNSHIWAEGTDAQVAALGGVHSSKGWAQQSTSVNISLTNSPYTTNRILEIPQDIKLELNNGTLTLKAGSKVYVPNGPGVFNAVTVPNDVVFQTGAIGSSTIHLMFCCNLTGGFGARATPDSFVSGSTAPSDTTKIWYDTTNNAIKTYEGGSWVRKYSLPIGIYYRENGNAVAIDQIFNGFGYIGSTLFVLPGVQCLVGNGRNSDGSCITKIEESAKVSTYTMEINRLNNKIVLQGGIVGVRYSLWFDEQVNMCYNNVNGVSTYQPTAILGTFSTEATSPWNITEFNPLGVDSLANSNASNFSQAGRSYLSGLCMPSGRYIDLTLGASGSTYTAPANGYFSMYVTKGDSTQAIVRFENGSIIHQDTRGYGSTTNLPLYSYIPARKGQSVRCIYTYTGTFYWFRFIYAEGENNV